MFSRKHQKKSFEFGGEDSNLGSSVEKKLTENSNVSSKTNCSQQFVQAASLTIKSQLLKKGLMNFNENVLGLMHTATPLKAECVTDSEHTITSKFAPLTYSTQPVKKFESTSESSDENHFNTERTIGAKIYSASEVATDLKTANEVTVNCKQRYKGNKKSKKKLKKNISGNHLLYSNCKEEGGSDGCLSVVEVRKPVSSYSVSSDTDSEEVSSKLHTKNAIKGIRTQKFDKIQKSVEEQNRLLKGQNRVSISMDSDEGQMNINENGSDSESYDVCDGKSRTVPLQYKSSLQGCDISSSDYESTHGTIDEAKKKYKKSMIEDINLTNFFDQNEGHEKLTVSKNAELGDLDSDDEVYLLQLPKTINPKLMEGVSFSLLKKCKLKLGSKKYCIRPQYNNLESIFTFSNNIKTIKPLATLKMEKYIKIKEIDEVVVEETKKHPLPSSIKVRHPFFGAEYELYLREWKKYKNKSKIKKEVPNYEEVESYQTPLKTKKKKQKYFESTVVEFPVKNEPLEEHSSNNSKQRRKSILNSTRIFESLDISDFQIDVSRIEDEKPAIKKRKHFNRNEEHTGNSDLINRLLLSAKNNLDNSIKKEKRKRK